MLGSDTAGVDGGCLWNTPSMLYVLLQRGHHMQLRSQLAFHGTVLGPSSMSTKNPALLMDAGTVDVEDDPDAAPPAAQVVAPNALGFCDTLHLDGSSSSGVRLRYMWRCSNCDVKTDAALINTLSTLQDARVALHSYVFGRSDYAFEFELIVTDFVGKQSAPSRAVVMRSSLSLPALAIDGPSNVEVDAE